jgi:Zn-dependent M16 (insulinase) family peptidase
VFASPSLQVGFAALTVPAASYIAREHAAELVLAHQLDTGALWEDIRMKGGAYGAFAQPDGFERVFDFGTYRDPNPQRSLGAFINVLKDRAEQKPDEDALEKAVIGSYAKETRPRTAAEKGFADFFRFLYGLEDVHREQKLGALIDVTEAEITAAARRLAEPSATGLVPVIIAGTAAAKKAAAQLGVPVRDLPV